MQRRIAQALTAVMLLLAMAITYVMPQSASAYNYYYTRPHRSVWHSHPIVTRTLTGGAIGAASGALIGAVTRHHRAGKGALIGAGVGSGLGFGLGLFRNRQYNGHWF